MAHDLAATVKRHIEMRLGHIDADESSLFDHTQPLLARGFETQATVRANQTTGRLLRHEPKAQGRHASPPSALS
jgi:hypothetical protein